MKDIIKTLNHSAFEAMLDIGIDDIAPRDYTFQYGSDGTERWILFGDVVMWDSELNYSDIDPEEDYDVMEAFIKKKFNDHVLRLNKINDLLKLE